MVKIHHARLVAVVPVARAAASGYGILSGAEHGPLRERPLVAYAARVTR